MTFLYIPKTSSEDLEKIKMNTNPVEERELHTKCLKKWGQGAQIDMAIEEMSELIQALCKAKRKHRPATWLYSIYEELADVSVMLSQMAILFDGEEIVPRIKAMKLERLVKRLEGKKDD